MKKLQHLTPEIYEAICLELEETWEGLSIICPRHNVSRRSFYNHKDKPENLHRYVKAREQQFDYLEELLFTLSMDNNRDYMVEEKVNLGSNTIARARLQVDTIKFVLGKLRSHVWGAKIEVKNVVEPRVFNIE